jgi:hypothetical protein
MMLRAAGGAAHHRRPDIEARLEGLNRRAVAVAVTPVIGVHEDVGGTLAPVPVGHSMPWATA